LSSEEFGVESHEWCPPDVHPTEIIYICSFLHDKNNNIEVNNDHQVTPHKMQSLY